MSEECSSCGAAVVWTETENGKRMPVDAEPVESGNVMLTEREGRPTLATYVGPPDKNQVDMFPFPRYVSHFATCPDAKDWRRE